jgi:hypothetical protein
MSKRPPGPPERPKGKKRGRVPASPAEKSLKVLVAYRETLVAERARAVRYIPLGIASWVEFVEGCDRNLARVDAAIRKVNEDGLPEGHVEKWGEL